MSCTATSKVWHSSKKDIEKEVLTDGKFGDKPMEGTSSTIVISDLDISGDPSDTDYLLLDKCNTEQVLVSGETDTKLDRLLQQSVETMKIHETSKFTIKIDQSIYKFAMQLASFTMDGYFFEWLADKKYALALKHKERGVELFKSNRPIDAFYRFSRAIKLLVTCALEVDDDSSEIDGVKIEDINALKLVLYGNLSSCHYKVKNYEDTIALCTKVLEKDENNVKALYKRGMASAALNNLDTAHDDLVKFLEFEPNNSVAKRTLIFVQKELALDHERFVIFCERIFGRDRR